MPIERAVALQVAESAMGHRVAKGIQFMPGARNRILFAAQRDFKSQRALCDAIVEAVKEEEFPSWMYHPSIRPNWIYP